MQFWYLSYIALVATIASVEAKIVSSCICTLDQASSANLYLGLFQFCARLRRYIDPHPMVQLYCKVSLYLLFYSPDTALVLISYYSGEVQSITVPQADAYVQFFCYEYR